MSKQLKLTVIIAAFMAAASFCWAANTNYYVMPPPNPGWAPPFTNWIMAATNLAEVIARAGDGDTIYVTNGHYYLTNEVQVNKAVIIRSWNKGITDPTNTIIDAYNYEEKPVSNRCLQITAGATIDGLTLTNGCVTNLNGGGVYIRTSTTPVLMTNCIITGNSAGSGGGICADVHTTITQCRIIHNVAANWAGGVYINGGNYDQQIILRDSVVGWNVARTEGSGVIISKSSVSPSVFNCDIIGNGKPWAVSFIGNDMMISNCVIHGTTNATEAVHVRLGFENNWVVDCRIVSNYCAGGNLKGRVTYRNCLIADNQGVTYGGLRAEVNTTGAMESCTITGNTGTYGGLWLESAACSFSNTIVSGNTGASVDDIYMTIAATTNCFGYCCCQTVSLPPAQGNIQQDPLFIAADDDNYRLQVSSPCIDAGLIQEWMNDGKDLDGASRVSRVTGRVDMGCFEHLPQGTIFSSR